MTILAIDPGTRQSAYVLMDPVMYRILEKGILQNEEAILRFRDIDPFEAVIEHVQSYGMPVGEEIFTTVRWIGAFWWALESLRCKVSFAFRKDIKIHLCGTSRAKDANIRQRLIDIYGGKEKAIGRKATPGPLYGFKADMWAALACGVYYRDMKR